MARTYNRDANGRFASSGGGGGGKRSGSKGGSGRAKAAPKQAAKASAKARPGRSPDARIERASRVLMDYDRMAIGSRKMTPSRTRGIGRRKQQHRQALANYYSKLSPANQKKAMTKFKQTNVMNA